MREVREVGGHVGPPGSDASISENAVESQEETQKGNSVCGQDMDGVKRNERKAPEATHGRANAREAESKPIL